ncbi:MAG: hypothetical protein JWO78_1940 [Micavibrio sp.]|nr:hypothetical protein [Micavibrio sp.]
MHFKNLAIAAVLANLCVLAPALSQAEAASLYNSTPSTSAGGTGGAGTPVFIPKPQAATPPVSNNLYTNSGKTNQAQTKPKTTPMSDSEYAQMAAAVERQNAAVGAQRSAAVNANFAEVAQQNAQAAASRDAAAKAAAGGTAAAGSVQVQPADPYAGHPVVFTGAKKTDEKPTRLFNVQ